MPRKTRRQLVGEQEDIERQEREDALRVLERELHLAQKIKIRIPQVAEPAGHDISQFQAEIMPLTVHM